MDTKRPAWSSEVAAQDLARDHHALHLARTLADAADAHLAIPPLERQVLGHAHAAVDLHGAVDDAAAALRRRELGDGGFGAEGQSAARLLGRLEREVTRGADVDLVVDQHPLNG